MRITEPEITDKTANKLGLTAAEFEKIKEVLGRTPNFVELKIYSVMWSEQCSFKNSIKWLKTLPSDSKRILVGAGNENAGLVDIGDGIACAFKIKSHNYSSDSDPYLGATMGFGGTHRGIFSMGARPIAALNSLRFGNPDSKHMKDLVKGVVKGIGDYGTSLGVPTITGEVFFENSFNQNILVDEMSVGVVRVGETVSAGTYGLGNPVFIVGSRTGKEEIHDTIFASANLNEECNEDLPALHVDDHLNGKLLLEACLDAFKTGAVLSMQDVGTGGIIFSSSEMSAKSKTGMSIDLNKIPTRQANLHAWEILLSESQERILLVGQSSEEQVIHDVFEKWDLECVQIGEVTNTGLLEYYYGGEKVAQVPVNSLERGSGAPVYDREYTKPAYLSQVSKFRLNKIEQTKDFKAAAKRLFSLPNLSSKRLFNEQYDITQRIDKIINAQSDAAVVPIENSQKSLVMTASCNPAYVHADPYTGAMIAIAEAARNIACTGGEPIAVISSLNFGNPHNPEDYYQFVNVVKGVGEACRKFNIPVAGCNVSFLNQSQIENKTETMFPTPTIYMLGILEDPSLQMTKGFKQEGDVIYMLGNIQNDLGSSEYLRNVLGTQFSPVPSFELHEEHAIQQLIRQLLRRKWLSSVHSVSEGGLFTNLMESAIASDLGFNIETMDTFRKDCFLFGETQSRVVVTTSPEREDEFQNYLVSQNVSFTKLGEVFGTDVVIDDENFGSVGEWKAIFDNTFVEIFGER